MENNYSHITTKYEQLNMRSRWYSSQLWYVPFAYVGLVGLALRGMEKLEGKEQSIGYLFLAMFSLAVFVHVLSIKYYERRTVAKLQEIESKPPYSEEKTTSGGGSRWHLSFVTYICAMLVTATFAFLSQVNTCLIVPAVCQFPAKAFLYAVFIITEIVVSICHIIRNRPLKKKIYDKMDKARTGAVKRWWHFVVRCFCGGDQSER